MFRAWTLDHTWAFINDVLRVCARTQEGRNEEPSAGILDSQSVKSDGHGGEVGYDAAKRHQLVDMLGLLLRIVVTPASVTERDGGKAVLQKFVGFLGSLPKIWVDGGYSGEAFEEWVRQFCPYGEVEVVKRSSQKGFEVLPKRWVVERTFGWLMRHRRLARDYERTESSAEAWIYLAMIRIQLNRLA